MSSHPFVPTLALLFKKARGDHDVTDFMNEVLVIDRLSVDWSVGGGWEARGDQSADGTTRNMSRRAYPTPRLYVNSRLRQAAPEATPAPVPEPQPPDPEPHHSDEEKEPGDWRPSRPASPSQHLDISEGSEATNRPTKPEPASRYANLNFWKARRVTFYRNGDPFHPGVEFRFKPGRDLASMDALLDRLSERLELPRGARFIFGMDGDRKFRLEELEDGASYVVSSYKTFKVRV